MARQTPGSTPAPADQTRVLAVEDDPDLRRLITKGLEEEGFAVTAAPTGAEALHLAERETPGVAILDVGLPDSDGRDVCQALRAMGIDVPVLFLTARDASADRLLGFGAGGDDYLTKPFVFAELVARVKALARRSGAARGTEVAGMLFDPVNHLISVDGREAELTPTEFRLLGALVSRSGEVLRRREIVRAAWPEGAVVHDNTLDVYVGRLRRKIASLDSTARIRTVHGVGYRLE